VKDKWKDFEVVILASGPSLTGGDIERVRQWREESFNRKVIVTNTTFKWAPWADVLFFHDKTWWKVYQSDAILNFPGEKYTVADVESVHVQRFSGKGRIYGNSGATAAALALYFGAKRVILLGCDAQWTDGKRHHFGDHPKNLGNARSWKKWPANFEKVASEATRIGAEIINCSRQTALVCFPRQDLEEVLGKTVEFKNLTVPEECLELLKEQRTHYKDPKIEYGLELRQTYFGIAPHLPSDAKRILDIASGMAGIDVFLSDHYNHSVDIYLADLEGVSEEIINGYHGSRKTFSKYNSFDAARLLLKENGVPEEKIHVVDLETSPLPNDKFDIVISLLGWGFHFPIDDYFPNVRRGGIIVADIRNKTPGIEQLSKRGTVTSLFSTKKFTRVLCQC
jgi:hypothetical protein